MIIRKLIFVLLIGFVFAGCSTKKHLANLNTKPVSVKTFETPPGADKNIPAEQGGEGFKGINWKTNESNFLQGSDDAQKGGELKLVVPDQIITLRSDGKDTYFYVNSMFKSLLYETLLKKDDAFDEFAPCLATHWQISDDNLTYRFRINPEARWADGKPVIANDVVSSWNLIVNPALQSPYINELFSKFEKPVAESKYIVSVKSKELNWKQFDYFATSLRIYPSHIIDTLSGENYLKLFQFDYLVGSGPYVFLKDDLKKGESVSFRRRSDYWAENEKTNKGLNNFDVITISFSSNELLNYEKFKKGEIDIMEVQKAQSWAEDYNTDIINKGMIKKIEIKNSAPKSVMGIALNMRKPPFNDVRVRKAFAYAFNRKLFNEKLFFNSYEFTTSFFQGTEFSNKSNPVIGFNLDSASLLLSEAGWKEKNSEGYLIKEGRVLEVELPFYKPTDRYYTIYQEDLKKIGVKANLKEYEYITMLQLGNERKFDVLPVNFSGIRTPNPAGFLSSSSADSLYTNNFSGIKDFRIDELCRRYESSFNKDERKNILVEIDKFAVEHYAYIFGWSASSVRLVYQNKFKYPDYIISPKGGFSDVMSFWYYDNNLVEAYQKLKN